MRIGLLTVPFNNNYGGYLQAYALMKVLSKMGHETTLIHRRHNPQRKKTLFKIKYAIKQFIKTIISCEYQPLLYNRENSYKRRGSKMIPFIRKHFSNITVPIFNSLELEKISNKEFDGIIVGSDQVWRSIYVPNILDYFLSFLTDSHIKRIAYAASFGTNNPEYTKKEIEECSYYIKKFDAISLRENSGLDVIKKFGWQCTKPTIVLDPTMLLSKEHYFSLTDNIQTNIKANNYFCYILNQSVNTKEIITFFSRSSSLTPYSILKKTSSDKALPSIEEWLTNLKEAAYVLTDSYHGAVFSILFNKPFALILNPQRGNDRFYTLLDHFNLRSRIINTNEDIKRILNEKIDWNTTNTIIDSLRLKSLKFLEDSLL